MESTMNKTITDFKTLSDNELIHIEGSWSWKGAVGGAVTGGIVAGIPGLITGPFDAPEIAFGAANGFMAGGMGK
ncbi:hypothetical protein C122C_1159 [Leuconostoc gelidum subsp. gasicomitatum]|mgnify:CR=1 FL=1|uniref:Class IIb bacteriocin, lactobin A/cerein 7B family n=1 Tax=Leuconostoc gasicomitatum TaxID=115778 RepID=A0ABP2B3H7_9LACO|nr:hypothetical protein [Leuconostoc gasicomitatum]CUW05343.1 hypothetical protein C122C_1159 [Leuconostoc gasicomitatum]CUW10566.1 hypothetical protein PB1E_1211 [Leuconostoc gasicomitatum]